MSRYFTKASKLLRRAGELGYTKSYTKGEGVERDFKKAFHYFELAAIGGDVAMETAGHSAYISNNNCKS